jgi:hypothetical protein
MLRRLPACGALPQLDDRPDAGLLHLVVFTTLRRSSMLSWGSIRGADAMDLQDRTDALRAEGLVGNGIRGNPEPVQANRATSLRTLDAGSIGGTWRGIGQLLNTFTAHGCAITSKIPYMSVYAST